MFQYIVQPWRNKVCSFLQYRWRFFWSILFWINWEHKLINLTNFVPNEKAMLSGFFSSGITVFDFFLQLGSIFFRSSLYCYTWEQTLLNSTNFVPNVICFVITTCFVKFWRHKICKICFSYDQYSSDQAYFDQIENKHC